VHKHTCHHPPAHIQHHFTVITNKKETVSLYWYDDNAPTIQSVCLQKMYRKIHCIFPTSSFSSSFCSPHNYILLLFNIKFAVAKPVDITFNKHHAFHPHHYLWEVNFMYPLQAVHFDTEVSIGTCKVFQGKGTYTDHIPRFCILVH